MNSPVTEQELNFSDNDNACILYGDLNKNLHGVEKSNGVVINVRGTNLRIVGSPHDVELVAELLSQLYDLIGKGYPVYSSDFAFGQRILESSPKARLDKIFLDRVYVNTQNRVVSPKTPNQKMTVSGITILSLA